MGRYLFGKRLGGVLGGVLLAVGWAAFAVSADVEMILVPPAGPVHAGRETTVRLFVHNYTDREVLTSLPGMLRYRFVRGEVSHEGEMRRMEPTADAVAVPPRGFVRALYALTPPVLSAGPATLEVVGVEVPPVLLAVAEGDAAPPTTAAIRPPASQEIEEPIEAKIAKRFSPHEPMYFLLGIDPSESKFQLSFKFRLFDFTEREGDYWHFLNGLNLAYTQTSFWDLRSESKPFLDSSYKPEVLYVLNDIKKLSLPWVSRWGLNVGLQHESNGKSGADSRSLNIAYLKPRLLFGNPEGYYFEIAPKAWTYVGDLSENPGIQRYRGYFQLLTAVGQADGLRISSTYQQGTAKASIQLDASYPLFNIIPGKLALFLYAQYFNGYGESLLYYNQKSEAFRVGFSVTR
jgi:phospholipase A1